MYGWRGIPLAPVFSPPSPCWVTGRSATLIWEPRAAGGKRRQGNAQVSLTGSSVHYGRYTERGFPTWVQKKITKSISCVGDLTKCFSCLHIWMTNTEKYFHCGWRTGTLGCWPDSTTGAIPAYLWPLVMCILNSTWLYMSHFLDFDPKLWPAHSVFFSEHTGN